MTTPQPSPISIDELPYLEDYLREVLRPRVERSLQNIESSLIESIWRHVVRDIAGEQPSASEATQAMIRSLIADRLGLRIQARVETSFEPGAAPDNRTTPAVPVVTPAARAMPDTVQGRRGPMPLVNAVLANPRNPAR